jgi:hypothetical protein
MLDLSFIPNQQQDIKIYYGDGGAWQTWQKPRKCNYVWIMCIGGGAGGSSSFGNFYTNYGGSGAVTRALFNATLLPDSLYIQVGIGGAGAIGTNAVVSGGTGTRSFISLLPSTTAATNIIMASGNVAASTAGETALTSTGATFITLANFISTVGATQPASDVTPLSSQITCPGAWQNGQTTAAGASILSTSISPLIQGGASVVSGTGGNGADGITSWKPFYSLGGAGGGGSQNGIGGKGGDGGIGSGGGTGGAGTIAGGNGGKGGDGLVVIISF